MSTNYDYFISYAREDNEDGFVDEFVERLVNNPDFETLLGSAPRVFFNKEAILSMDDWESKIQAGLDASRSLVVLLSPNYFQSEYCAMEFERWLGGNEKRGSLPDAGVAVIQIADVPGLFDDGEANVPQELRDRFPNWISQLHERRVSDDFDLRERSAESINRALAALCRYCCDNVSSQDSAEEPTLASKILRLRATPRRTPQTPDGLEARQ